MAKSSQDTQAYGPSEEMNKEAGQSIGLGSVQRSPYWGELQIEEKIERMRELVKSLVSTSDSLRRELAETRSFIWDHAHEENGDVIVKIKKGEAYKLREVGNFKDMLGGNAKTPNDEVYF